MRKPAMFSVVFGLLVVGVVANSTTRGREMHSSPTPANSPKAVQVVFTGLIKFEKMISEEDGFYRAVFPDFRDAPTWDLPEHYAYVRFPKGISSSIGRETHPVEDDPEIVYALLGSQQTEILSLSGKAKETKLDFQGEENVIHLGDVATNLATTDDASPNSSGPGRAAFFDIKKGTLKAEKGEHAWRFGELPEDCASAPMCFAQEIVLELTYPPETTSISLESKGQGSIRFDLRNASRLRIELGNSMIEDIRNPVPPKFQYADPHFLLYYRTLIDPPAFRVMPFRAKDKGCGIVANRHGSNCPPVVAWKTGAKS